MPNIILRPGWHIPDKLVTAEKAYRNRRQFLRELGFCGFGAMFGSAFAAEGTSTNSVAVKGYPYPRNPEFNPAKVRLTDEEVAISYNNFYEFSTTKTRVRRLTGKFVISPWDVQIGGLVEKPMKLSVEEIMAMFPLEERVYRFRCVEAWSMVVPWTGFPLSKLIEKVVPKPQARFVKFTTFVRPEQAPGFLELSNYPWPYREGLRMDEAMNPLTLFAVGVYGHKGPNQNGAPLRLVTPWKYGFKGIKAITSIRFVEQMPKSSWQLAYSAAYGFYANVNPNVNHPSWSQATERRLGGSGSSLLGGLLSGANPTRKTLMFNGYADQVASMYTGMDLRKNY